MHLVSFTLILQVEVTVVDKRRALLVFVCHVIISSASGRVRGVLGGGSLSRSSSASTRDTRRRSRLLHKNCGA